MQMVRRLSQGLKTNRCVSECHTLLGLVLLALLIDGLASRVEIILQSILNTMLDSDSFSPRGKDIQSRFWSAYERMATQHDGELLDRNSNDMDVLLIFVCET